MYIGRWGSFVLLFFMAVWRLVGVVLAVVGSDFWATVFRSPAEDMRSLPLVQMIELP